MFKNENIWTLTSCWIIWQNQWITPVILFLIVFSFSITLLFGILSSVGDLARTCDFAHFPPINMAIRILHGWKFLLDPRKMLPPLRKCTGNKLSSGYNFWPQLRFIVLFKPNRSTKSQSKTFSKKRNFRRHTILNFDFDWQLIKKWRQEIYNLIDWLWAICRNLRRENYDLNDYHLNFIFY